MRHGRLHSSGCFPRLRGSWTCLQAVRAWEDAYAAAKEERGEALRLAGADGGRGGARGGIELASPELFAADGGGIAAGARGPCSRPC